MQDRPDRPADESGFTLIELLISIVVLGLIASGVAASIIMFFNTTDGTTSRLALSHDSQLLATYLIPDLDSLTGVSPAGQPSVTSSGPGGCSTGVSFSDLRINYSDLSGDPVAAHHDYVADYNVSGSVMTRTFKVDGVVQPAGVTKVVHNLKHTYASAGPSGSAPTTTPRETPVGYYACLSGAAPWTVTVTTETNNRATSDYTFSVTGGGRVTTPAPPGAPALCAPAKCTSPPLVSLDTNHHGHIDEVVATFDQPLVQVPTGTTSQWHLDRSGQPVTVQSVALLGNQAVLTVNPGSTIDTVESGLEVALTADPNGIRNGANQDASFALTPVTDGMAPVPTSIVAQDRDGNGKADHVVVTFSETLLSSNDTAQWTLNALPGATVNSVAVVGNTATLTLDEGSVVDTIAKDFTVALAADPAGIQDANGNQSSFNAMHVSDGMAPAPISIVSKDTDHNGKVDEVVVTFSESLVASTDMSPWSLAGVVPDDVTIKSVSVGDPGSPNTATLFLKEGATFDTAANGFKVSLDAVPPGVKSSTTPNVSAFGPKIVSDGMNPVVVGMKSTNVTGGTAGKLEAGDTLTLTFSEPLALASGPTTLTLTPGGSTAHDMLTISGLATVDLGANNAYATNSGAVFSASLTNARGVVTITVATTNDAGNVLTATADTIMKVTPSAVTDIAANPAVGTFTTNPMVLF